ncbi:uncharacterized protein LOC143026116 isoform X6 [Oratosquilla oratoria]|uniref:uncharacterized protein LOC143026116 isoform X6 n=1 Tax=Oratosquilla oratoria TaxID=337810 RepID=UPI003F75A2FA
MVNRTNTQSRTRRDSVEPKHKKDVAKLDKVQKAISRWVPSLHGLTSGDRLDKLEFVIVEERRERGGSLCEYVQGKEFTDKSNCLRKRLHKHRLQKGKGTRPVPDECCSGDADLGVHEDLSPDPGGRGPPSEVDKMPVPGTLGNDLAYAEAQANRTQSLGAVHTTLLILLVASWLLGAWGASPAWLLGALAFLCVFVKSSLDSIADDAVRRHTLRIHQQRALQADETAEWLNVLLNRWWVFSSSSIFARLKEILDPRLNEAKPSFVEAISLKQLTLGEKTPVFRSLRTWDVLEGADGSPRPRSRRRPLCPSRPPPGLSRAHSHTLALQCELALDSESFSAVLEARIGGKGMGVDLEVAVEKLAVIGRLVATMDLDASAPFPHVTRLAFSFVEKPQVWFSVRILKAVQMMEVPILKTWLHSVVMDALATAWVDPGQLEVNLQTSEGVVPTHSAGSLRAEGVLTVTVRVQGAGTGPSGGIGSSEDEKWVALYLNSQTHVTAPLTQLQQETASFLVTSLALDRLVLKVKSKRLISTATLVQFDVGLAQYNFEYNRVTETVMQRKGKVIGGASPALHVRLEYTPISPVSLEVPSPLPLEDPQQEGAGVLFLVVHSAEDLPLGVSGAAPSPYCLILCNRRRVKTSHFVARTSSPRWESEAELLVRDVPAIVLSFAVCGLSVSTSSSAKSSDKDLIGLCSLSLSSCHLPVIRHKLALSCSVSTPGSQGSSSAPSTRGYVTVSVVFRPVSSVSSGSLATTERMSSQDRSGSSASTASAAGQRRGSFGAQDEDDGGPSCKRRNNSHWIHQAKSLLVTGRDGEGGSGRDLEDMLASGMALMELIIVRARDLEAKDLNGYSDPYCVVKASGEVKYRTRVKKKTLNPQWDESLMTHLPRAGEELVITLWDHDAFGMRDFLGSVTLNEDSVRELSAKDDPVWYTLAGVKTGQLEIKVKIISEDFECNHRRQTTEAPQPVAEGGAAPRDDPRPKGRGSGEVVIPPTATQKEEEAKMSSSEDSGVVVAEEVGGASQGVRQRTLRSVAPSSKWLEKTESSGALSSAPVQSDARGGSGSAVVNGGTTAAPAGEADEGNGSLRSSLRRGSESSIHAPKTAALVAATAPRGGFTVTKKTKKGSISPRGSSSCTTSPAQTPAKQRRSGAQILQSALGFSRTQRRSSLSSTNVSSTSASFGDAGEENPKSSSVVESSRPRPKDLDLRKETSSRAVPKISLNGLSEDEFSPTETQAEEKEPMVPPAEGRGSTKGDSGGKKTSEGSGGFKAMRAKILNFRR